MPAIDPFPHVNLLPFEDLVVDEVRIPTKQIVVAAVRLVLSNPKAFVETVRWLKADYSVAAFKRRHEQEWEADRQKEEQIARSSPSIEELKALRGDSAGYSPPTSWQSKANEDGIRVCVFNQAADAKRRAEARKFDPVTYERAMWERERALVRIDFERRNGRPVSQVDRLRLAMRDLAEAEMEIGGEKESHARKLVLVAYLLVWHETCDDLGEFGRWRWDGQEVFTYDDLVAYGQYAEGIESAQHRDPPAAGRDRTLFIWWERAESRNVDPAIAKYLRPFMFKLNAAIPLLPNDQNDPPEANPGAAPKATATPRILLNEIPKLILLAALELVAMDAFTKRTAQELINKALPGVNDYNSYKRHFAALKRAGLLESLRQGSSGGYWLSEKGHFWAKKLDQ